MIRQPLEFTPESALEAISRSGYHHIARHSDRSLLEPFMAQHGLVLEDTKSCFTVTLVPSDQKSAGTDWERIRLERLAKREKAAMAKKKKEHGL